MYGWAGGILDVDLSTGRIEKRPFDPGMGRKYIGGRGVNSFLLNEGMEPGVDPLSPDNMLIFGTGPLGGTLAPSANRMSVTAKSWQYNGVGTSNVGGSFAPELKWAGYDHIVIRGKADGPVYLWISDDEVELRSAGTIWGKTTWETDQMLKDELGDSDVKVACIGPAGEKLVKFAHVTICVHRAAAQTGMGTVMGSKNLKAIAVRGTKSIEVARPERLRSLSREMSQRIMKNPSHPLMSVHGTPFLSMMLDQAGIMNVRNYQQIGDWEGMPAVSLETFYNYYTKDKACYGCPIHCGHYFEVKDGPYKGERGGGIEAGHILPFGPTLDNRDPSSLFKCLNLCNQYGMDTMEAGYTIGAAMEWYEKGIITQKDTDGIALEWGNQDAIIEMIHKMGKREGIGDLLAEGAVHAAEKIGKGAINYVSHCKGMMVGCDDPRPHRGTALNHATTTIPAHHEEGQAVEVAQFNTLPLEKTMELYGTAEIQPTSFKKAAATIYYQNLGRVMDAMEICKFASGWFGQEIFFKEAAELFSVATGMDLSPEEMELAGERINDLERAFAARDGMTRKDDHLQGKVAKEPVPSGPYKGVTLDPEKFDAMLDEYYELRGWDKQTGVPTREKLEKVGLPHVADELVSLGKL